jgi:hypothetical protein
MIVVTVVSLNHYRVGQRNADRENGEEEYRADDLLDTHNQMFVRRHDLRAMFVATADSRAAAGV